VREKYYWWLVAAGWCWFAARSAALNVAGWAGRLADSTGRTDFHCPVWAAGWADRRLAACIQPAGGPAYAPAVRLGVGCRTAVLSAAPVPAPASAF